MNNYKPIFYNEKLLFSREEKNGYVLISLKEFPELREMVINRTMWEIFLLCDGKNTLADILDIIVWSDTIKVQCQNCRKREEERQ